ncbi:hypothetical protein DM02DRAFT_651451 [Periconia macrospinosa]|uniref:Uncharacterized protein n=1 Tax=Periconia macrospinosa TaxID=97972 RepID=A0A2V1E3L1_9PLEO|nr:hypothetical protein DM02DRAFT_651451 [Periconia macrospinosa]
MAPPQDYRGPVGLTSSRYANPQLAMEVNAPSAAPASLSALLTNARGQINAVPPRVEQPVSSTNTAAATNGAADTNGMAARNDKAVSNGTVAPNGNATINNMAAHPAVKVAVDQAQTLKEQVEEHSSRLTKSITAARNTRQILNMLHDSMKRDDPQAANEKLHQVESLWKEMESFHTSVQDARATLHTLLEKQSNAVNLALGSVMNSAYAGVQDELKTQHQKVEIQHSLIIDQQRAFEDAKARLESQMQAMKASHAKELNAQEVKISNLTLKNGCLRTDLEEMAKKYSAKVTELEKLENLNIKLQTELENLTTKLRTELENLSIKLKTERDFNIKINADLESLNTKLKTERDINIKLKTQVEMLEKELNDLREKYKNQPSEFEKNALKLKTEAQMLERELMELREKYKNQSLEYGKAFASVGEEKKHAEALRKQISDLENSFARSQKELIEMTSERDSLLERESRTHEASSTAVQTSKTLEEALERKDFAIANKETELKTLKSAMDIVKNENAKLINKHADFQEKFEHLSGQIIELKYSRGKLKTENDLLKTSSDQLNDKLAENNKSLEDLKAKNDKLRAIANSEPAQEISRGYEQQLEEANKLVTALRERYKAMLPIYKQADEHRKENEELKEKLLEHEMNKAKGKASTGNESAYWRSRYEELLKHFDD